ncbi:MAG: hypothetical protein Q9214_004392, partial [Letrouitia sp. 1 TL-2023]
MQEHGAARPSRLHWPTASEVHRLPFNRSGTLLRESHRSCNPQLSWTQQSEMAIRTSRFPGYALLASSEVDPEDPQDAKVSDPQEESHRNRLARAIQVFVVGLLLILATNLTIKWTAQRVILSEHRCDNIAIRKEWRNLNNEEKTAYLRAVQCLRTIPSRLGHNQTLFDDFAYFHTRTGEEGVYQDEALSFAKVL